MTKRQALQAAVFVLLAGALSLTAVQVHTDAHPQRQGFTSLGGGPLSGGGGATTIHTAAPVQGTGSSGSAITIQTSPTFTGTTTVANEIATGELRMTGSVTASALGAGPTADWDPSGAGMSGVYVIHEAPSADATVSGMLAGDGGQEVELYNDSSSFKLILNNEDGSEGTAARRFTLANVGAYTIPPQGALKLRYRTSTSRWVAVDSATTVVTAGTSLTSSRTGSSITLNVNLPGGTCTLGKGVTAIAADGTATCGAVVPNNPDGTHYEFFDDFLMTGNQTTGVVIGVGSWVISGTGSGISSPNGIGDRPGIIQFSDGTSGAGRVQATTQAQAIDFGKGNFTYESVWGVDTLSDGSNALIASAGFYDTGSAKDQVDGCYFFYDQQNSATGGANSGNAQAMECACASNSSRTIYLINGSGNSDESFALGTVTVGALTLPNTNIMRLKVVMTGTTRAEFYSSGVKVCDINTHIPSGSSRLTGASTGILQTTGTTARTIQLDWAKLTYDLTSARSP